MIISTKFTINASVNRALSAALALLTESKINAAVKMEEVAAKIDDFQP
jgi:hypothetical protein